MADRRRRSRALLLAVALTAVACSSDEAAEPADEAPAASAADAEPVVVPPEVDDEPTPSASPFADRSTDELFDPASLHTFEFTVAERDLQFLDSDPTAEEYVRATMTFEGETIEVGLRYKGSIGAFVGCVDGPNLFDPSGAKSCTKLSMKVRINWNDGDDEFFGVRKLQLHSMNLDPSQLRERVGYHLLREMGVAAPRSTHARVVVNGEFVGLFALTENIDGRFTRANFNDGTGNLYKEVWPFTASGTLTGEAVYLDSLRTNEGDEGVNASLIRSFAEDLLASDDPASVVRRYMDVEQLMSQLAVDRTIRHDDGPFHWYCDDGTVARCGNHNFFFYEDPTAGSITMIPWDLDNAFSNILGDGNPVTPIPDGLGDITAGCEVFTYGGFGLTQRSASCDPLFAAWASMEDDYLAAVQRLHEGPLRADRLDPLIDTWIAQITAATVEAAETHDDALDPRDWEMAQTEFRRALDYARYYPIGG